ncbi:hypothetical protein ERO13_A02G076301v2 [Gossypium hirsutum]|uniref:Uncharacterized protein n=1 Tax=Gossypium darwinii TaxID=34276 RepID=A0A5D2HBV6_GOSDA|nr:hypothetical protein ERO13_A02G076301v2 [Gossypium hirsutum]TYH27741.1 hypothetical protein ES288_A02G092200v1 [Gossypium darwinii]
MHCCYSILGKSTIHFLTNLCSKIHRKVFSDASTMTGSEVIGFGVSKMVHLSSLELHLKEGVLASAETGNINEGTPNENRVQVPQHTRADPREEYMNSRTFHTRAWIQALRPNMQLES